eukprot:3469422-Alexandrium_andersonii.AAC.1
MVQGPRHKRDTSPALGNFFRPGVTVSSRLSLAGNDSGHPGRPTPALAGGNLWGNKATIVAKGPQV